MNHSPTIQKTDQGWIIEIPDDFADATGIERNSIGLLMAREGKIEVEIIPPPSPQLEKAVDRIYEKYKDAFAEMKRLGD